MRRQVRLLIAAALAASSLTLGVACKRDGGRGEGAAESAGVAAPGGRAVPRDPLPAGAVRVSGKNFHVDAAPVGSHVLADLTALEGFKVNRDYPYRFVPDAASRPHVEGEAAFAVTGAHTGRLMVPLRSGVPAGTQVGGTFKLSVCSAEVCQIEDAVLSVAIGPAR
jgi:hypothetical protein